MHARTRGLRSGGLREGSHAEHERNRGEGGAVAQGAPHARSCTRVKEGSPPLPSESLGQSVVPQRARNFLRAFVELCQGGESILQGTSA